MSVKEAVKDNFETVIAEAEKPVVVYMWGTTCQACKLMSPQMEKFNTEHSDQVELVKINITEHPEVAEQYGVMSTPTVMVFKHGVKPKIVHQGFAAKNYVWEVVEKYI
jgi:thioredoxin 1